MGNKRKRTHNDHTQVGHDNNVMHDLDVPMHKDKQIVLSLLHRLIQTKYSVIALSHRVHGKVSSERDNAAQTIPSSIWSSLTPKNNTIMNNSNNAESFLTMSILKRLNVIMEQVSDLSFYTTQTDPNIQSTLHSYDIIAITPTNDTVFSSLCQSTNIQHHVDIITLDYTLGRGNIQLPFKLKSSDIATATKSGLVFEIPYAPALTDVAKRKAFVQTASLFLNVILSMGGNNGSSSSNTPKLIISSGSRLFNGNDHGSIVLRTAADMTNFVSVVLLGSGSNDNHGRTLCSRIMSTYPSNVVSKARDRQGGLVQIMSNGGDNSFQQKQKKQKSQNTTLSFSINNDVVDDGSQNNLDNTIISQKIRCVSETKTMVLDATKTGDLNSNISSTEITNDYTIDEDSDHYSKEEDDNNASGNKGDAIDDEEEDDLEDGFLRLS